MFAHRYVEEIDLAAMLATNGSGEFQGMCYMYALAKCK